MAIELMLMILLKDVSINVLLFLGLILQMILDNVYLDALLTLLDKITLVNVFKTVHIGVLLLIT